MRRASGARIRRAARRALLLAGLLTIAGGCGSGDGRPAITGAYVSNGGLLDIVEVRIGEEAFAHLIVPGSSRFYEVGPGSHVVDVRFADGAELRPEGWQIPRDPVVVHPGDAIWIDFTE